jgi:WD40 repeat protein
MTRWLLIVIVMSAALAAFGVDVAGAEVPGDNGRIAYVVDSKGCDDCHVFTVEADGTDRVKVTDLAVGGPEWSPDGTRLIAPAFGSDGRVSTATMNPDGSGFEVFEIPDPTLNVACWGWSPDGERLACESWDETRPHRASGIFTVDSTDGQDLERLTANPFGSSDLTGDFSPDGSRYAFIRLNDGRKHGTSALFVVNADGTGVTRLTRWTMDACCSVSWSPDGERLLFGAAGRFYTMRPDGSEISEIALDTGDGFVVPFQPSWSPDGTRFVFSMYVGEQDQVDIFTAAADGSDLVRVTDTRREDGFADWGPSAG